MGIDLITAAHTVWDVSLDMIPNPCSEQARELYLGDNFTWVKKVTDIRAVVFLAGLIVATITDLRHGKIYDMLTLPLMIYALANAAFAEYAAQELPPWEDPEGGLAFAVSGGLVCFGLMFLYYVTSGGGGGDVKLATAIGFGFGSAAGLQVIALAYFSAWVGDKAFVLSLKTADKLKFVCSGTESPGRCWRREIRMAPWFLLATLPILAGCPLL